MSRSSRTSPRRVPLEATSRVLDASITDLLARLPAAPAPRAAPPVVAELRAAAHALIPLAGPAPPCPVREYRIDGLPSMRIYAPDEAFGTCVFLHGGGFVRGDLDTHDVLCRHLAIRAHTEVVAVDYRLAPEHPFPAAWNDAHAAVTHVSQRAVGPVCIAGDSAGGCIAAATALAAHAVLVGQLLLYPVTDATLRSRSLAEHPNGPFLSRTQVAWSWEQVRGKTPADDPRLSPLHARELAAAPRAFVLTAEHDPVRDDGAGYVTRLRAAGVPVEHVHLPGAPHNIALLTGESAIARDAVAQAARWLRRAMLSG